MHVPRQFMCTYARADWNLQETIPLCIGTWYVLGGEQDVQAKGNIVCET